MAEREVRFCTTEDGVRIAYCVEGEGPPLVVTPFLMESFALEHLVPQWEQFFQLLKESFQLVRYDMRGVGSSEPGAQDVGPASLGKDLEAVVQAAGLRRFALLAWGMNGPVGIEYTAKHQSEVQALALYCTYSRGFDIMTEKAGTSLAELARANWSLALRALSQSVNTSIRALDKLSIAAINGITVQTGLSLALSCDFRLAAKTARMSSATLRFGLQPDEGGHYLLVQTIGVAKTMDFLMRKRVVDGVEAQELGLVHEAVEPEQLMDRAMELARELAQGPQVAMRLLKRSVYNAWEMNMAEAFDDIATKTAISDHHPDAREGIAAFRDKRTPHFNQWLESE